jgi:hypothetical protein
MVDGNYIGSLPDLVYHRFSIFDGRKKFSAFFSYVFLYFFLWISYGFSSSQEAVDRFFQAEEVASSAGSSAVSNPIQI